MVLDLLLGLLKLCFLQDGRYFTRFWIWIYEGGGFVEMPWVVLDLLLGLLKLCFLQDGRYFTRFWIWIYEGGGFVECFLIYLMFRFWQKTLVLYGCFVNDD